MRPLPQIAALAPYSPGLSIDEIREKYGLAQVIKLASNENPLGTSPFVQEAISRHAANAFRYPQSGNPRLVRALAELFDVPSERIVVGNGSDEIIDLLIRILVKPGEDNIVCFEPCFSIYPIQAAIAGVEARRVPLREDFSFDFAALLNTVNEHTRLVFVTTPDNPSGYCPPKSAVREFAGQLYQKAPDALLVADEAYMDFAAGDFSLVADIPENVGILRTFSKCYGLAGLRIGFSILPSAIADAYWRARLPFSLNILAEEAALAALADTTFRSCTLETVKQGRRQISEGLESLGCKVWPSHANFVMFRLPDGVRAKDCFEYLLRQGIIIRPLRSYNLPENLRVSVGKSAENEVFLAKLKEFLEKG